MSAILKAAARGMSAREKFLFDLNGFVLIKNVLCAEEVQAMNSAIDAHIGDVKIRDIAPLKNTIKGGVYI